MTSPGPREGVTRFVAQHDGRPLDRARFGEPVAALAAWRTLLAATDGIGQDPARYDGAGYGNVSCRIGPYPGARGARAFVVSGTQTGGLPCVDLDTFCVVTRYDVARNRVESYGPLPPSSESMTHGTVYDLAPSLRAVLHVHCPVVFRRARALGLPATAPHVEYGTPEMAREVERLWRSTSLSERRCFVMAGHEDGVVAFGRSLEEAGHTLLSTWARAQAQAFLEEGEACRPGRRPSGTVTRGA